MLFSDRIDAAVQLIPHLEKYTADPGVIFAVPRGGVPLGFVLAQHFNFPLEILLTRKIGHPLNKEVAIGSASLEDYEVEGQYILPPGYLQEEVRSITDKLKHQYQRFMGENHRVPDTRGRTVFIVDDGAATGNTVLSAIKILRRKNPAKIIVALPVASPLAISKIIGAADEVVCLFVPENFHGVSQFYVDFAEVHDTEVERLLREANARGSAA